ncbi:hypothetical protein H5410_046576 [Solanum commersonii]|uniref:Uncharacterized protein n=1 Tax=Solanum commersonii TaxID=4109 RepID=A0A9J5XG36_SOLCO|nr:hypothetical protein H5410_046576 [Solanum commersonii]
MERPQPRPTAELAKLRADVDALTVVEEAIPKPTPEVDVDDVVLNALFEDDIPSLDPPSCGWKAHTHFYDHY